MPGHVIRREKRRQETPTPPTSGGSEAVPVTQETTRPKAGNRQGSVPQRFDARALHREVVGEFRRYGVVDADITSSRPQTWETRRDWEEILP